MRKFYDELEGTLSYSDLLNTVDWDIRRHQIFKRDNYTCQGCGCVNKKSLEVHHKKYIENRLPWDYPDEDLITLCCDCHSVKHTGTPSLKVPKTWFKDPLLILFT